MAKDFEGGIESPGGFVFGIQGWTWGEPRPRSITFFLDGTAKVSDQHGRPIPGTLDASSNKKVNFALKPPSEDDIPEVRAKFANHKQVIEALSSENIEWKKLDISGWPQLTYDELKKLALPNLPPSGALLNDETFDAYVADLRKIKDSTLRKDALKYVREVYENRLREEGLLEEE